MRLPVLLLLALVAVAGCRLEPRAEAPADAPPPSAPGLEAPAPPSAPPAAADGTAEVVLYVTEWCPYCAQAREYMAAEGVPHRVVDIEKDPAGAREYQARGGDGGIPLVAVGDNVMKGWSPEVAEEMLAAAGYE